MKALGLGEIESKFADIIWENEPITSSELARLADERLLWKKSTSYTILKRLCERGIFKNDGGTVRSLISREDFYAEQGKRFLDETFGGSLPAFVAAFGRRQKLSDSDITQLKSIIEALGR